MAAAVLLAASWAFFARRRDRAAALLALAAVVGLGAALFAVRDRHYRANPLHELPAGVYVEVAGRLHRSPGREPDRDVLDIDVRSVTAAGREKAVRGRLRLGVPFLRGVRPRLDLLAGEGVRASVRLGTADSFRNFGGFSYQRYLQTLGIHRRGSTKSSLLVARAGPAPAGSLRTPLSRLRRGLQRELERFFPAPDRLDISREGAVLEALLLGEDGRLDAPTVENLQATGLYHLFAISGGHIAILYLLLFSLFRLVRMSRRASALALAVFLVLYTAVVEGSPSVLRATLMTLAVLAGRLLWKDVHVLNTIAASAFVLLVANPASLYDAGFQLTYAATLAIILYMPPLVRRLPRLPLKLTELAAMSAAAFVGAAPIVAGSFNRIALAAFPLNFPAIPLVGIIMGFGYAFLPFAAALPGAAALPAAGLKLLVALFGRISHALDAWPFLAPRVPTPPTAVIWGYALSLALALARPRHRFQRPAALISFLTFFALLAAAPFRPACPGLRITLIDVGQGESILVELPGRRVLVIDGGGLPATAFDVGERVVAPVLWRKGITRIDHLVLTHPHPDHCAGLAALARDFRIGEFWEGRPGPMEGRYKELAEHLPRRAPRRRYGRGIHIDIGPVAIDVLSPAPAGPAARPAPADNEGSLVLRLTLGHTSFLLMGDAGPETEQALLESGVGLASDVLKAGHHGSGSSTSAAFLAAVRPRLVLVSAGAGNTYGFPSPAVLARCARAGAEVLRTDLDGAVEVLTDGHRLTVRTAALRPGQDRPARSFDTHD